MTATYQTDDGEWTVGDRKEIEISDGREDLPIFVHSELDDLPISADAFRVYAHLARRRNKGAKVAWPSYASMGQKCFGSEGIKPDSMRRRVIRAINELTGFGLIRVQQRARSDGGNTTNHFHLTPRSEWNLPGRGGDPQSPPSDLKSPGGDPQSPKGTTREQYTREGEQEETAASRPAAQDELALAAPSGSTPSSPRTEKKARAKKAKPTALAPDAKNYHREMFAALAALCKVDTNIKRGQLNAAAKTLLGAGYKPDDLDKFSRWWYSQDFRGQQGKPPAIGLVGELILQAVQWVPWVPPAPGQPQKKSYDMATLRQWHRQYWYEQWIEYVAAEHGVNPFALGAFDEWYDTGLIVDDDRLADWYEWWINRNKENGA